MLSITLKQLELFISVAETKSFSKTADLLAFFSACSQLKYISFGRNTSYRVIRPYK